MMTGIFIRNMCIVWFEHIKKLSLYYGWRKMVVTVFHKLQRRC